jgi:tetratricopeptide (TPR) repeat protein
MGPVSLSHRFPLFGRDDVVAAMEASVTASFNGACPGLFTLIGDSGLGKTRLVAEGLGVVDRLRPGAAVIFQRAAQPLADAAGQTTRELLGRVLGVHGAEPLSGVSPAFAFLPPEDPRAFCRGRLGEDLGEEVWRAVAVTLGWSTAEALSVTPGAVQRGTMLALTEGLRRLARDGPVALVLDDAHWADDTALDALEYATLNAEGCPLWVLVAAHPRFENVRRGWGSRAQRHDRMVLGPLEEAAGMQLAAELLLPAEYPPAATLKRLADWAGGNPACLAELARTLKRAGIVRQRPNLGTWYVATAELDRLPPSTAWQWLAVRQLDALQPELAACVRLCSVMGVEFTRTEVEWVQDAMEREGSAVTPIDMGVGLGALVERRILLRGSGDRYSFQSSTFQDAVYKLLDSSHRERIHRYALSYFRSQRAEEGADAARALERLARHAGACAEREEAAEAYLMLGDAARERHRHVEADQHYTSALMFLSESDIRRRALALAGRGKIRYRVYRLREALDDLREARELAGALGDDALTADLLLEEATALDFANDLDESERRVEEARVLVERIGDRRLELRFWGALGRSCYRQEQPAKAIELLQKTADGAREIGDYETRAVALILLAPLLAANGQLDEADARFQEVLALCTEAEDRLHLTAVYANRAFLWIVQKQRDRSMDDLRRAIQLAREVGNPWSECIATANVAEFLHWLGEEDEALIMTRRARVLEERFMERPIPDGSLLLARIQAARGDLDEVAGCINWIIEHCRPTDSEPTRQAFFETLRLVLDDAGVPTSESRDKLVSWNDVVLKVSEGMFTEELLEVLYWRARVALGNERWDEAEEALKQVEQRLEECSMWRLRFASLMSRLALRQPFSLSTESGASDELAERSSGF